MTVSVIVPRRAGDKRRDAVWAWLKPRWEREHPGWQLVEGHDDPTGPFNRSRAINRGASEATGDVLVIADGDTFTDPVTLTETTEHATDGRFWLAYSRYHYLNRPMSDQIMDGYQGDWFAGVEFTMTNTCSSMIVLTRGLFDQVHGFDERFEGWGFEDVAFSHACQTFGGGLARTQADVWHLWHPPSPENNRNSPIWRANRERMLAYGDASYDRDAMSNLIEAR